MRQTKQEREQTKAEEHVALRDKITEDAHRAARDGDVESTATIPRRARLDLMTPAERAIYDAVQAVEAVGADVRLTDAVVLLQAARYSVADYVDGIDQRRSVREWKQ